jgi:hypothetical protein
MANTYPNYDTTLDQLPDRDAAVTGQDVGATYWARLAGLCNYLFGAVSLPRVGQSWTGGTCRIDDNKQMIAGWRIPLASSRHTTITCYARARNIGAAGSTSSLIWTERAGGTSATVAVAAAPGAAAWYSVSLVVPSAGDYAQVDFGALLMGAGGELEVLDAGCYLTPLASPLAAASATTPTATTPVVPCGVVTMAGDYPLDSARLKFLRDLTAAQFERRRILYCWTALTSDVAAWTLASAGKATSATSMQTRPHQQLPRIQAQVDPRVRTVTIMALCQEQAAATVLYISIDGVGTVPLQVAAGAAQTWVTTTVDMTRAARRLTNLGDAVVPSIEVNPSTSVAAARPLSTATLLSISIWGV